MAVDEAAFKQEVRESVLELFPTKLVWCPADKFSIGIPDLHVVIDKFYGIEAKFCKKLPARGPSKILQHPFTETQIRFMDRLNRTGAAVGCGLIWMGKDAALVVKPEQIDADGNMSRDAAEALWSTQGIHRTKSSWDLNKLMEITRGWNG